MRAVRSATSRRVSCPIARRVKAVQAISAPPAGLIRDRMTDSLHVIIAVINNKGGVGKTTAAVNIAAALATARRRVIVVDLDSQASASVWFGVDRERLKPSSATCLLHGYPARQAIRTTGVPHLDLITGSPELANADLALADVPGRELTLKQSLQGLRQRYELVILDCPPSLSLVTVNALVASDALIVPVPPQHLAVEALTSVLASADRVRTRISSKGRLLGILLTMVDQKRASTSELRERVRAQHRERVFLTEIPESRALEEAPAAGKTIFEFAPRSRARRMRSTAWAAKSSSGSTLAADPRCVAGRPRTLNLGVEQYLPRRFPSRMSLK